MSYIITRLSQDKYRDTMALLLRTNSLHMANEFVSSRPSAEAQGLLVAQLRAYRYDLVPRNARGVQQPPRKVWGGKTASMSDDLAVGAQMACFWPGVHQAERERCLVSCI